MVELRKINTQYKALKEKITVGWQKYNENYDRTDLSEAIKDQHFEALKELEKSSEEKVQEFIKAGIQFGKVNQLSDRDLVIKISNEVLKNPDGIHHFLLINLMWSIGKTKGVFCLKILEELMRNMLESSQLDYQDEYYLECYIEIWTYDTHVLIPIDILEAILLLDIEKMRATHGAMIKAAGELYEHPKEKVEKVLAKVRMTKSYQKNVYFREWIDN
ncbi:MAG: hypothetical protein AAFO07_17375 [Bacteroidota bacterium]